MKIELITPEQHETLLNIYKNHTALSLQNEGYEYINKRNLSDDDKDRLKDVEDVLKNHIMGFSQFSNFRLTKDDKIQIRLQYNWGADDDSMYFGGVGYILLDELLNGFN